MYKKIIFLIFIFILFSAFDIGQYFYLVTNIFGSIIIGVSIVFLILLFISKNRSNKKLFRRK